MYLVQLKQNQVVDHCVVVNRNRRVDIYSAERYPLKVSVEVFRLCGGDVS